MPETVVGGYTPFSCKLSAEARAAFDETLGKLLGVTYSAVAAASQVVNGTNYRYLANADAITNPPQSYPVLAVVHVPRPGEGKPQITSIEKL